MKKNIFLLSSMLILLAGVLSSCATGSGSVQPLTDAEKDALTAHIRKFISRAKTLRLSPQEMQIIQNTKPKYTIHYEGYKRGFMYVRWQLPAQRALILQRTGNLMGNTRSDWMIRLIKDKTDRRIPEHVLEANREAFSTTPAPPSAKEQRKNK